MIIVRSAAGHRQFKVLLHNCLLKHRMYMPQYYTGIYVSIMHFPFKELNFSFGDYHIRRAIKQYNTAASEKTVFIEVTIILCDHQSQS